MVKIYSRKLLKFNKIKMQQKNSRMMYKMHKEKRKKHQKNEKTNKKKHQKILITLLICHI